MPEQRRIPGEVSPEFIQYSKDFFRRKFGQELTDEDVREIVVNVTAYFKLLNELYEKYKGEGIAEKDEDG